MEESSPTGTDTSRDTSPADVGATKRSLSPTEEPSNDSSPANAQTTWQTWWSEDEHSIWFLGRTYYYTYAELFFRLILYIIIFFIFLIPAVWWKESSLMKTMCEGEAMADKVLEIMDMAKNLNGEDNGLIARMEGAKMDFRMLYRKFVLHRYLLRREVFQC